MHIVNRKITLNRPLPLRQEFQDIVPKSSKSMPVAKALKSPVRIIHRQNHLRLGVSGLDCAISALSTKAGRRGPKRVMTRTVL